MKYRNQLIISFFIIILFTPITAFGALKDPRCFTKNECIEARTSFLSKEKAAIHPLYQGSDTKKFCGGTKDDNGEDIGFCYPSTQAFTSINIGGKTSFNNIGEYIQVLYTYSIVLAGIIAVLVIIVSGIQWTASGGNSTITGSAKTRIVNAIIGLIIAIGSYVILNTLNPYLINFRLPQAWMIKPQVINSNLCINLPPTTNISKFAPAAEKKNSLEIDEASKKATYVTVQSKAPECGFQYLVKGSDQVCLGSVCEKSDGQSQVCISNTCVKGKISGKVINSKVSTVLPTPFTEDWGSDLIDGNENELWVVCKDGKKFEIDNVNTIYKDMGNSTGDYLMQVPDADISTGAQNCTAIGVAGYILKLEMDEANDFKDENHWVGKKGSQVVDLGDDVAMEIILPKVAKTPNLSSTYLMSEADIAKGFTFDIDIAHIYDIDNVISNGSEQRTKAYGATFGVTF